MLNPSRITVVLEVWSVVAISLLVGASLLHATSDTWEAIGPLGGQVNSWALAVHPLDPNVVFVIVNEKLYVTSDGGATWTLLPTCPADAWMVKLDPSDGGTIYVCCLDLASTLYKSTDAGDTWTSLAANVGRFTIDEKHPNRLFVAGWQDGDVRKSLNYGGTWTSIPINDNYGRVASLAVSPGDSNTLYAGKAGEGDFPGNGMYKSVDGGANWVRIATGLPSTDIDYIAMHEVHPETVLAGTGGAGGLYYGYGVYRSTNGGASWSAANTGLPWQSHPQDMWIDDLNAIPGVSDAYCLISNGQAFRSDDAGATWSAYPTGVNDYMRAVDFWPPGNDTTKYFGADHGIWKVTTMSCERHGIVPVNLSKIAVDPNNRTNLYGVGDAAYISRDCGLSWDFSLDGTWSAVPTAIAINPQSRNILFVGADYLAGVYRSEDSGASWDKVLSTFFAYDVEIDPVDPDTVYAGGRGMTGGALRKSTDNGLSWPQIDNSIVTSIAVDPTSHNTVYIGTNKSGIKKSTNGGTDWVPINTGLPAELVSAGTVSSIAVNPLNADVLYCAGGSYGAFRSTNGGAEWTALSGGLPANVATIVIDPSRPWILYSRTQEGVFRSADSGQNWVAMNTGLSSLVLNDLIVDPVLPNTLYCCSAEGLFRYEYDPAGVDEHRTPSAIFMRVFPNPFSSAATIQYSVASTSHVRLKVYDVAGHEVATLVDARLEPGQYMADLRGAGLSAGVYFIEGRFGDQTVTRKCVLMR